MSSLSQSSAPQTVARTAAQTLIVPVWMARQLTTQLRALAPGGGLVALLNTSPPQFDVQAAAFAASFR